MKLFEFDEHIGGWRVLVQTRDMQTGAVVTRCLADGAVTTEKLADGAVTNKKIADNTIDGSKFAPGSVTGKNIKDGSLYGDHLEGEVVVLGKISNDAVQTRNIKDRNVTGEKLALHLLRPEHFSPNTILEITKDLRNQIDSLEVSGVALSNMFGQDPHIGISQKTLTQAYNKIWEKLEEITGESLLGISMTVSPKYFISENGCNVHVSANTVAENGIFERISFYRKYASDAEFVLIDQREMVDAFSFDTVLNDSALIKCVAQVLGVEYTKIESISHYNSFWLGCGSVYTDVMDGTLEHLIPVEHGMRGAYDVTAHSGDHIFIILGESLAQGFIRADMNGVEISFIESTVTVDGSVYKVFTSENVFDAGTYNIDING